MATNLIKETEDIYSEKIKEMVNETLDIFGHDEKVWQKKKTQSPWISATALII